MRYAKLGKSQPLELQRRMLTLVAFASMIVSACGATSASPSVTQAGAAQSPGAAANPGGPAGATTLHLVVSDGPKAGTYDVSTTDAGACSTADTGYFAVSFNSNDPGLNYIAVSKQPSTTGFLYGFDSNADNKLLFTGSGAVSVDVTDSGGATADVSAVSDTNFAASDNPPISTPTGKATLTVHCGSVLRPNSPY